MNRYLRGHGCLVTLGLAVGTLFTGCQSKPVSGFERFVPSTESARAGVTRAMEEWLKGPSPDESSQTGPELHVVDQTRLSNQKLAAYEILGEEPAENARAFAVRVTYKSAEAPEIVRYVAVGVDPMWVFRKEDYDTIWMHEMEAPADRAGEPTQKP